jgi:hypothetical protein
MIMHSELRAAEQRRDAANRMAEAFAWAAGAREQIHEVSR